MSDMHGLCAPASGWKIIFLKRCKENGVCPTSIQKRVHKARAYHSLAIERVFLKDDIARSTGFSMVTLQSRLSTDDCDKKIDFGKPS